MTIKKTQDQFVSSLSQYGITTQKLPPVEQWNPDVTGEIDIRINREGEWFYQGEIMTRKEMVKLFSSILRKDGSEYYLVTPVEKMRITVDVAPFSIVDVRVVDSEAGQAIIFKTNVGDEVLLDQQGKLTVETKEDKEPIPLLMVRNNLKGLLNRNVFYQLVDMAEVRTIGGVDVIGVWSCGEFHKIGLAHE